ncbi:MAG TPA: ATP-binding protein [Kofleriaceae bacterium]|nr:ATP-binding protein [Kofleriaceae bacterium]
MKLRLRFTLSLALAALVPITVAAVVTRQVIADSYRATYLELRRGAQESMVREIKQLSDEMKVAAEGIADPKGEFAGPILSQLSNKTPDRLRYFKERGDSKMKDASLAVLTVTDHEDQVIISPHLRAQVYHPLPEVRRVAHATRDRAGGKPRAYFAWESVQDPRTDRLGEILVVKVARTAADGGPQLALWAGRQVRNEHLDPARFSIRIDARVVDPAGKVLLPPRTKQWTSFATDPPIRLELPGVDGKPVAVVEIAVSDGDMANVLRTLTYLSAGLAIAALGVVVLIGLFVARRTARDLDLLVEGSLAAARGDLDHRVPVRSKDEIGAVASAFNFMMEDLRTSKERLVIAERIAAWQEIARRLAHEIKNPLTPIQMAMDTLRKTWKKQHPSFGEILEDSTATVLEEADRLKRIVTEFSDFARMPKPEFQRLDLNEVIRSSLTLYQGAAPIEVSLLDKLPQLDADKGQVSQVVLNLVENARDAIGQREGGKIAVSTALGEAGDRAVLVVEDNGPGVPPELKDKVFAPYFSTKLSKGGTGLGLAIVHRIVSDHGGRISVTDRPGGGARFTIELPLRNGAALLVSRI